MKPKMTFTRLAGAGLFAAVLALAVVQVAQAEPDWRAKQRSSGFNLRASSTWNMATNRVACGLDNQGNVCTDVTGSPTGGGGFWPGGPPMQYIFNSGLQIAGIIPPDAPIWAGDTVGAYFFDARGTQPQGQQITLIYSSANPEDLTQWPNGAMVRDASLYDAALLGRQAVSQEDTWMRYWDGPSLLSGRLHPMGIMVEQRGLAWNYPSGNEDILYFIYTFTNITASDPSAYAGIDAGVRDEIAQLGADWVAATESRLGVDLPSQGYRIDSLFAAFAMDPDVGNASVNASTAILPFSMGVAYKTDFNEPTWLYPPEVNGAPFGPYPGFIGVKYLKSPVDPATGEQVGLTLFSNTTNGGQFPDPRGVVQLWRYLSGRISLPEGDPTCTINPPIERRLCSLVQVPSDTRFYQSSGPLSLTPGGQGTIVVAYVHAAPIAAEVLPYYQSVLNPGIPPSGREVFQDPGLVRVIERASGWLSAQDDDGDLSIDQEEVRSVDRSLLQKAMVAQSLFDAKFLLPFAPETPEFFLVPGDNQVTIVWQPSSTETVGDPYYAIASDPGNALADANYRQIDVEGYRIYRGRSRSNLQLIAQFDYAGTTFDDYRGLWAYTGRCAPELGILDDCPADFPLTPGVDNPVTHDLVDAPFVAIEMTKPGGRVELADGSVFVTETFNPVQDAGFPDLTDSGVPFAYVDNTVVNSTGYFYSVTAFDVNSIASGPGTLESPLATQSTTPRAPSGQVQAGLLQEMALLGADGTELDRDAPLPTIDPATGIFSGPMPPTNGIDMALAAFLPDVLVDGEGTVTIDSIIPGDAFGGTYGNIRYFMTASGTAGSVQFEVPGFHHTYHSTNTSSSATYPLVAFDDAKAGLYGGDNTYVLSASAAVTVPGAYRLGSWGRGDINGDPGGGVTVQAGPRWWGSEANETLAAPNSGFCTPSSSFAGSSPCWTDLALTAGELPGVDLVWRPASYSTADFEFRNVESITSSVYRAADFEVVWGANGTIASVTDLTHNVPVEFHEGIRASWGFLTDQSFVGTDAAQTNDGNNSLLTWADLACLPEIARSRNRTMCRRTSTPAHFVNTATLSPISDGTSNFAGAGALTAAGNGFIFYLNGHFFLMRMTALPADGTVWHARFFAGYIRGTAADGDYEFGSATRPAAVPGLRAVLSYTGTNFNAEVASDSVLDRVHTVPDPYYVTSGLEVTPTQKVIKFVNLPAKAAIRIYSLSGVLVNVLEHNDPTGGGEESWNVRNRNQQFVASGVYFYHVETPDGNEKIGRFTVVNASGLAVGAGIQ